MNIKQALFHNTGWKIITLLFTFVNNIIIVRLLGAEASASFFYAIAVFTLLSTVLRFGLENSIIFYASKDSKLTGPLALFLAVAGLIQAVLSYAALHYFIPEAGPYTLPWIIVFIVSNVFIFYATAFYQVKRMYISVNIAAAVTALLQTAVLAVFYFSKNNFMLSRGFAKNMNDAVLIVLAAAALFQVLLLMLWFYRQNKAALIGRLPDAGTVKNVFRYSAVNFTGTVLMFLIMRADFYFVEKYCSGIVLANYVQVAKIGQMALIFPGLLGGVIFPYTVNAPASFAEKISFFCRMLTGIFVSAAVVFIVAGKSIFIWLLGADFYLVYPGICGTFAGIYFLGINLILISYFEGRNQQKIVLLSNLISLFIVIATDYFLVPVYGMMAAAIVFSAANFAGMLVLAGYFITQTGTRAKELFLPRRADSFVFRFWK